MYLFQREVTHILCHCLNKALFGTSFNYKLLKRGRGWATPEEFWIFVFEFSLLHMLLLIFNRAATFTHLWWRLEVICPVAGVAAGRRNFPLNLERISFLTGNNDVDKEELYTWNFLKIMLDFLIPKVLLDIEVWCCQMKIHNITKKKN